MNTTDATKMARQLMDKHGLSTWEFRFDKAYKRFGSCSYYSRRITLSRKLTEVNDESAVRDTILHEIAHALVPARHGHDRVWRTKALEIGCNGKSTYSVADIVVAEKTFIGRCPKCSFTIERFRRSRGSCPICSGGYFKPEFLIKWERK